MKVIIRGADPYDIPTLINLCQMHADYEELPFEIHNQEERLLKDLFSDVPKLYCLLAVSRNEVLGYLTFMPQYATWTASEYLYMDCLFVMEKYRSNGIGKDLIDQMVKWAGDRNFKLIQWHTPEFNKEAMKFYHRLGAHSKTKERFFLPL